jgi:hypothetical protein
MEHSIHNENYLSPSLQVKTDEKKRSDLFSGQTSQKVTFLKQVSGTIFLMVVGEAQSHQLLKQKKKVSCHFLKKISLITV